MYNGKKFVHLALGYERPTSLSEKHKTQLQCHPFNESGRDRNFVDEHLSPFAAATGPMHIGTNPFFQWLS